MIKLTEVLVVKVHVKCVTLLIEEGIKELQLLCSNSLFKWALYSAGFSTLKFIFILSENVSFRVTMKVFLQKNLGLLCLEFSYLIFIDRLQATSLGLSILDLRNFGTLDGRILGKI